MNLDLGHRKIIRSAFSFVHACVTNLKQNVWKSHRFCLCSIFEMQGSHVQQGSLSHTFSQIHLLLKAAEVLHSTDIGLIHLSSLKFLII